MEGCYDYVLEKGNKAFPKLYDNSYFKTGDLCEFREGHVFIIDRLKDVIVSSSGENISPVELERIFQNCVPHGLKYTVLGLNEEPTLIISLPEKCDIEVLDKITQAVKKENKVLPIYKKIKALYFINTDFPVTSIMKVKKNELKKMLSNSKNIIKEERLIM